MCLSSIDIPLTWYNLTVYSSVTYTMQPDYHDVNVDETTDFYIPGQTIARLHVTMLPTDTEPGTNR